MPNRVIREGILTSTRVDQVAANPAREVFYRRLQSVVDDYGRFTGDPRVIRAACYPLRLDSITENDIAEHLRECERAELLRLYSAKGKPYLEMIDFNQQLRIKRSKYPEPPPVVCVTDDVQPMGVREAHVFDLLPEPESESEVESEVETTLCAFDKARVDEGSFSLKAKEPKIIDQRQGWFAEFWEAYKPIRSRAKADALKAFLKIVRNKAMHQRVLAAVHAQTAEMLSRAADKRPYAATWLRGARYEDEAAEASQQPQQRSEALDAVYEELRRRQQENNGIPESN